MLEELLEVSDGLVELLVVVSDGSVDVVELDGLVELDVGPDVAVVVVDDGVVGDAVGDVVVGVGVPSAWAATGERASAAVASATTAPRRRGRVELSLTRGVLF